MRVHWDRRFQIWQYTVSHSGLLLRSFHPSEYESRVDIFFASVGLMMVKPSYAPLEITTLPHDAALEFLDERKMHVTEWRGDLFVLNDGEGYVQAAACEWHEDRGDHHTPSKFGPLRADYLIHVSIW